MSSRNQNSPKKPLPREVYMRRRVAAVVVLVVVILLLWWFISSLGGNDSENTVAQSQAVSSKTMDVTSPAEPPNEKSTEPKASETSESSSADSSEATITAAKKDTCTVDDLQVTATPGAPTFADGEQPNFYVNVKNPTGADCEVDFDTDQLLFEVFTLNNYQRVWGDLDCNSPEVRGTVDIPAGEEVSYELGAWSRTTSAPGQCDNRTSVSSGSYLLYTHVGDNVSEPATFNLS